MNILRRVSIDIGDFFRIYWVAFGDHPEVEKALSVNEESMVVAVRENKVLKMEKGFNEDNIVHFVEKVLYADSMDVFPGEVFTGSLNFNTVDEFDPS